MWFDWSDQFAPGVGAGPTSPACPAGRSGQYTHNMTTNNNNAEKKQSDISANHNNTTAWVGENEKFFLPPVCNKMMHNDQLKVRVAK